MAQRSAWRWFKNALTNAKNKRQKKETGSAGGQIKQGGQIKNKDTKIFLTYVDRMTNVDGRVCDAIADQQERSTLLLNFEKLIKQYPKSTLLPICKKINDLLDAYSVTLYIGHQVETKVQIYPNSMTLELVYYHKGNVRFDSLGNLVVDWAGYKSLLLVDLINNCVMLNMLSNRTVNMCTDINSIDEVEKVFEIWVNDFEQYVK